MTNLANAMAQSPVNSAIAMLSNGNIKVDGVATRRFGHYEEDNYWVQGPSDIKSQHYSSMDDVKSAIGNIVEEDIWIPLSDEDEQD